MNPTGPTLLEIVAQARCAGRHQRVVQLCNVGLNQRLEPSFEAALRFERARALAAEKHWSRAELDCRRALEQDHAGVAGRVLLAECLVQRGRNNDAIVELELALALEPRRADSWRLLAELLSTEKRHDEAISAARTAWQLAPQSGALHVWLRALAAAGRHRELGELCEGELAAHLDSAEAWAIYGTSLSALGRSPAAIGAFRRALTHQAEHVAANCGLALALLREGELAEGFRHNEYRQKKAGDCHRLGVAPWRGQALGHLLVWAEQGYGDTLQFARYLPLARRVARQTTFMVPPPLVRLLRSNPALGSIATNHPGFGAAEGQVLAMSLPHRLELGGDDATAGNRVPYLFAEAERVERWRQRLPSGPRVALVWQGNPRYAGDPWRSMPFARFEPLLLAHQGRVHFLSLQKAPGREQLAVSPARSHVLDLSDSIDAEGDAFVDSIAILSQIDLLITTDTSMAHLAGAAGVRTWVLLGNVPDWRWGAASEQSPFYPTVRLFRKDRGEDWDGVIAHVSAALAGHFGHIAPVRST